MRLFPFIRLAAIAGLAGAYLLKRNQKAKEALVPITKESLKANFSFQGHRGARGLLPENTIPSFLKCIELGYSAFELDVVISQDKKVVVSHEAWMNPEICSKPNGTPVSKSEEHNYLLYQMPYEKIRQHDCGKRQHPKFARQKVQPAYKPLLEELIDVCDTYTKKHQFVPVLYNIEIKSHEHGRFGYGKFNPEPDEFAELVYDVITSKGIQNRCIVQSFDPNIVRAMRAINTNLRLSLLVDNLKGLEWNINNLGFIPEVYAPHYNLVSKTMVEQAHELDMEVITWTVNRVKTMRKLIHNGVDGIISDYPDLFEQVFEEEEKSL